MEADVDLFEMRVEERSLEAVFLDMTTEGAK